MLLCILSAFHASATSLGGLSTEALTAGTATIASCDTDIGVSYTTQGGDIASVTVSGLADPSCEGGSLTVQALNSSGTSIASAGPTTVPVDADSVDNTVTLSLSPRPTADQVDATAASIVGP